MMRAINPQELKELYYKDFPLWVEVNLELLKEKAYEYVDWENLLEEIRDMGQRHLDSVISYLAVILEHLYKWDHFRSLVAERQSVSIERVGYSWIKTVENARTDIETILDDYPSLRKKLPMELERAWRYARSNIIKWLRENDLNPEEFQLPRECPYTYEEAISRNLRKELKS